MKIIKTIGVMTLTAFIMSVSTCNANVNSINADGTYTVDQYGSLKKNIKGMDKKGWDYKMMKESVLKNHNMNTIKNTAK